MIKFLFLLLSFIFFSCHSVPPNVISLEKDSIIESESLSNLNRFIKRKVAIGRFSNETTYGKGFFETNEKSIGKQAQDILTARLVASEKFIMIERDQDDIALINKELEMQNLGSLDIPADYLILGSLSEFGRKTTSNVKVFNRTKQQTAYAKVNIRLVDVATGQIIYSEEGSGEAFSEAKTSGLGNRMGYDSTLNDKVISAAISKLVNNVIENLTEKPWRSYILDIQENQVIIAGGESQGLQVGDIFNLYKKGKIIKNPQTGMNIELPGELSGTIKLTAILGNNINDEISYGEINSENQINIDNMKDFYVQEIES